MEPKTVDQKRPNQAKANSADGSVLNYATKHKNGLAMKEWIFKILKNRKIGILGSILKIFH